MNVLFQSSLPLPHLLYKKITAAKSTLVNMVGTGATRIALLGIEEINVNTSFGAFSNKFIRENREGSVLRIHGSPLRDNDVMQLKREWHKFYAHCLREIDTRFPPENMVMFRLLQVLDPYVVHGTTRRNEIGGADLSEVVRDLLFIFELPWHQTRKGLPEEVINSFTAFRSSEESAELWDSYVRRLPRNKPFDYTIIYAYYKELLANIEVSTWCWFCLFCLVMPTGNAISERGFSAMGSTHGKGRSEMGNQQVFANMMIAFNGPTVTDFAANAQRESDELGDRWWGYVHPNNFNT